MRASRHLATSPCLWGGLITAALLLSGCATTNKGPGTGRGYSERGIASWYGPGFHGKQAANGETYDMHSMTAAHRHLPFDTVVEVRNLDNDRRVIVRINDRGPFVRGRIIDLSYAAARQLEMVGPGTARVEIRVIHSAPGLAKGYWVQVGSFQSADHALALRKQLRHDFANVTIDSYKGWHRVRVGPFTKRKQAVKVQRDLARRGHATLLQTSI